MARQIHRYSQITMPQPLVKICGLTRYEDARLAASLGADMLGYILVPSSKRATQALTIAPTIQRIRAEFPRVLQFAVTLNAPIETNLLTLQQGGFDGIQLHGEEPPEIAQAIRQSGYLVIKAIPIGEGAPAHDWNTYPCDFRLADTYHQGQSGGTGRLLDATKIPAKSQRGPQPLLIAGGLTPDNLRDQFQQAPADGLDVSSGIEESPGIKSHQRLAAFIQIAKSLNPPTHNR